jgi:hypothetical protein
MSSDIVWMTPLTPEHFWTNENLFASFDLQIATLDALPSSPTNLVISLPSTPPPSPTLTENQLYTNSPTTTTPIIMSTVSILANTLAATAYKYVSTLQEEAAHYLTWTTTIQNSVLYKLGAGPPCTDVEYTALTLEYPALLAQQNAELDILIAQLRAIKRKNDVLITYCENKKPTGDWWHGEDKPTTMNNSWGA